MANWIFLNFLNCTLRMPKIDRAMEEIRLFLYVISSLFTKKMRGTFIHNQHAVDLIEVIPVKTN